jgi:hypothetical protein
MSQRTFNLVSGMVFAIVVVVHLLRLFLGWPVVIGSWAAPTWLSWLGCVVAGTLSFSGFRLYSGRP